MLDMATSIQTANVAAIEALDRPNTVVLDVLPVPMWAFDGCMHDTDHGKGVVYFPGMDGGCLACALPVLEMAMICDPHASITVEVYA